MARLILTCERAECQKQFSIKPEYAERSSYCCSGCRKFGRCTNHCDERRRRDGLFGEPPPADPPPIPPQHDQQRVDARIPPRFLVGRTTYEVQVLNCLMNHYVPAPAATEEQNRTKEHVMKAMIFMHHPDKNKGPDAETTTKLLTDFRDWFLDS